MNDITALMATMKAAAVKAGCEQWQTRKGFSGVEVIVKGSVARGRGCISFQPVASDLADGKTAKTVALFSPANVKTLVEALEKAYGRIAELDLKLAKPVRLPKTNGYWTEQEKAYEEAITLAKRQIRLAGFQVIEGEGK